MTVSTELSQYWPDQYVVLILDNEVTLEHFVGDPVLPWIRLVHGQGAYRVAEGYPQTLDAAQAKREMKNWDTVNSGGIQSALQQPGVGVDCFVIGNNAGQGLPMASALERTQRATNAFVIFGTSLPEQDRYEALGYREFCARADVLPLLLERAHAARRNMGLAFINTIQHNEFNYHDP